MGFTMGTLVVRGFWEGQEELVSALGPAVAGSDEQGVRLHPQAGVMRITLHPPNHEDAEPLPQQALAQKRPAHHSPVATSCCISTSSERLPESNF